MDTAHRLLTRSDFDGLVCAVLLTELELIGEIKFVHPKDMQDGRIDVTPADITANVPYVEGVHLAFDHHASEQLRVHTPDNLILDPAAPSAARVVFNYYGGRERFRRISTDMLDAVDKGDTAQFTRDEVLAPERWNLLNFLMDARTGLGRFRNFRISNYQLMRDLIDYCRDYSIEEILQISDVAERVRVYREHQPLFKAQIHEASTVYDNVLMVDLRAFDTIYAGNRFVKYALFPHTNISIQIMWGFKKQNTVISMGKSIFDRSCAVDVGELMHEYGGGGHKNAGTCQIDNDSVQDTLQDLLNRVRE
jgi:nanoRNase/pAp phosphatase (c-di-AMP/oligoRNAs hydrolase)